MASIFEAGFKEYARLKRQGGLEVSDVMEGSRRGSEIYLASGPAGIPGAYPTDFGIALQFRNGRLTGWKKDWQLRRPWPF